MSPVDVVLSVVFVALLVGFPAFTWWETSRAYRRAALLLDSWGRVVPEDTLMTAALPVHQQAGQHREGQEEGWPVVPEGHHHHRERDGERDDGGHGDPVSTPLVQVHPLHITVRGAR